MDARLVVFLACVVIGSEAVTTTPMDTPTPTPTGTSGPCDENMHIEQVCVWDDVCDDGDNGGCSNICESVDGIAECKCNMTGGPDKEDIIFPAPDDDECPDYDPCEDAEIVCPKKRSFCEIQYPKLDSGHGSSSRGHGWGWGWKRGSGSGHHFFKCKGCRKPAEDKRSCVANGRGMRRGRK